MTLSENMLKFEILIFFNKIHKTKIFQRFFSSEMCHSTAVRNLTKVWKTGPLQGDIAWSRGPESELFVILQYRDH